MLQWSKSFLGRSCTARQGMAAVLTRLRMRSLFGWWDSACSCWHETCYFAHGVLFPLSQKSLGSISTPSPHPRTNEYQHQSIDHRNSCTSVMDLFVSARRCMLYMLHRYRSYHSFARLECPLIHHVYSNYFTICNDEPTIIYIYVINSFTIHCYIEWLKE